MKLTKKDRMCLIKRGCPETDFRQIEAASAMTVLESCGKRISRKQAESLIGRPALLSGYARSAFHYTAVQLDPTSGKEVYFDAGRFFRDDNAMQRSR